MQLVSGLLMTSSEAVKNYHNPAFRLKMLLILLAAFNFWLFHATSYKRVAQWDNERHTPLPARLAGALFDRVAGLASWRPAGISLFFLDSSGSASMIPILGKAINRCIY